MMTDPLEVDVPVFYKATRPSGRDFRTGTVDYAGALASGDVVRHPAGGPMVPNQPATYLSVSVEPAETLIGGWWSCRLFRVEPVGDVLSGLSASPYKRAVLSLRVIEELPSWQALGPNGRTVVAIIDRAHSLTYDEAQSLAAARNAARNAVAAAGAAAREAARNAARAAAWEAARAASGEAARAAVWASARNVSGDAIRNMASIAEAAWSAVWDTAWAELVHDLSTDSNYRALAGPWIDVLGDPATLVGPS